LLVDPLASRLLHPERAPWPGPGSQGSVILPLCAGMFSGLPAGLQHGVMPFHRKQEFHLTLLNRAQWLAVASGCGEAAARAAFAHLDWRLRADGRYWMVRKRQASGQATHTVIASLESPALHSFREQMARLGVALEAPRPHVTLYWSGAPGGIGIAGPAQWAERVVSELRVDWVGRRTEAVAGR
jgi:hypothetical protein